MNVTQLAQNVDAPASDPVAEVVRGLARDRSTLMNEWKNTNRSWVGYDDFVKYQADRIRAIDERIDSILKLSLIANKEQ